VRPVLTQEAFEGSNIASLPRGMKFLDDLVG
jgi:hypothetical protein